MTSYFKRNSSVVLPASSRPKKTILAFLLANPKLYKADLNQFTIHILFACVLSAN
jgi:hypothetical protein